jgi:hypothetical protein
MPVGGGVVPLFTLRWASYATLPCTTTIPFGYLTFDCPVVGTIVGIGYALVPPLLYLYALPYHATAIPCPVPHPVLPSTVPAFICE